MNTSLLSRVDCLIHKLGPISATVDAVIEHLVPQETASACSGLVCYSECVAPSKLAKHYSTSSSACRQGIITCTQVFFDPVDC